MIHDEDPFFNHLKGTVWKILGDVSGEINFVEDETCYLCFVWNNGICSFSIIGVLNIAALHISSVRRN